MADDLKSKLTALLGPEEEWPEGVREYVERRPTVNTVMYATVAADAAVLELAKLKEKVEAMLAGAVCWFCDVNMSGSCSQPPDCPAVKDALADLARRTGGET